MTRFRTVLIGAVLALVATAVGLAGARALGYPKSKLENPAILSMSFPAYEEQKVVYHVTYSGGFRDRAYRGLLAVAANHVAAVGEGWLDLRILMQGEGADLMVAAKSNPEFAEKIDDLKRRGVKFVVCWNTLNQRGIDPETQMYGVKKTDIVQFSMAEMARLTRDGFVYLKP